MEKQYCPVCSAGVTPFERYPRYLCPSCAEKVTSADGRRLEFDNVNPMGTGFVGRYADTGEPYPGHECFVGSFRCHAEEARFGGIVVQVVTE